MPFMRPDLFYQPLPFGPQQQSDGADLLYAEPLRNLSGSRIIQQNRAIGRGLRQGDGLCLSGVHKNAQRFD